MELFMTDQNELDTRERDRLMEFLTEYTLFRDIFTEEKILMGVIYGSHF